MEIEFKVHGVAKTTTNVVAEVNGEEIRASAPCYEVELTAADPRHGSLTMQFIGKDAEQAKTYFPNDGTVIGTFLPKAAPATAA